MAMVDTAACNIAHARTPKPLILSGVGTVVVHRCDLHNLAPGNPRPIADELLTGAEMIARFQADADLGTAYRRPYHALIRYPGGEIEQMLPLGLQGAHCRGWNYKSLAVTLVGNCDQRPPTKEQWASLVWVCVSWSALNGGLAIRGHTDIPGGSGDPNKRCPGRYVPMAQLVSDVESLKALNAGRLLLDGWQP